VTIIVAAVGFGLGLLYGRFAVAAKEWLLAAAGLLVALLLGNYPYYEPGPLAVTYIAALAGVMAATRRRR
jgi:hypothetical protein